MKRPGRKYRRRLAAALLASLWLVSQPQEARAEPITIAIASYIGVTLTAGSFAAAAATFALTTAVSLGLNYAASLLKDKAAPPASGTELSVQYGGAVPRHALMGEQATGGRLVYANVYGNENKYLQAVYEIGTGLHDSLTGLWYNGKQCTFGGVHPQYGTQLPEFIATTDEFGTFGHAYVKFYNGSWDQVADSELVARANPAGRWTSAFPGRGVCYAIITQIWHEELGLTGFPDVRFQVRGLRLYDPRYDTTAGGSGPQRWGQPDTYVWTANPVIHEYNYRRGIWLNDQLILGMGVGPADLILPMYVAAANACDEAVPLKEGGTEPRYRCGTVISSKQQHSQALEVLRNAYAGYSLERAGQFGPLVGVSQIVNTTLAFTDDDLLVGQKASFSKYRTRSELATAVYGRFSDPAQKWEAVGFPGRENTADDALIGERIGVEIDLTQVSSSSQAQRIAEITRRRALSQASGTNTLGAKWIAAQPGDWIAYNSARHGNRTVEVQGVTLNPDQTVTLSWQEVSTSLFSWTTAGELDPPVVPVGPQPGTQITVAAGVSAVGVSLPADGGLVKPGINFTWIPIYDPAIDALNFEYRKKGDTVAVLHIANFPSSGQSVASAGVQPATVYEYRHRLSSTMRTCEWSAWVDVTSGTQEIVKAVGPGGVNSVALVDGAVIEAKLAAAAVTASKLADEAVERAKFAAGLVPVEILATLPATGLFEGRQVYLTTEDKLYRYDGSNWVSTVPAGDVTGQLTDAQIAALAAAKLTGQITTTQIADGGITTPKIATGAVVAGSIAAGAITASKIAVGSGAENLVINGDFEDGITGWALDLQGGVAASSTLARSGLASLNLFRIGGYVSAVSPRFPIEEGVTYAISAWQVANTVGGQRLLRAFWYDSAGALLSVGSAAEGPFLSGWSHYSDQVTAPAGARSAAIVVGCTGVGTVVDTYHDNVQFRRLVGTVTIEDGAITASKVTASAITTVKLDALAVTTAKIAAGAITTSQLAAGAVTAGTIAVGAITASKMAIGGNGQNLVINGDFEDGILGWTHDHQGGTIDAQPFGRNGAQSLRQTRSGGYIASASSMFVVEGDQKYSFSVYQAANAAGGSRLARVQWYTAAGAFITQSTELETGGFTTGWTRYAAQVTAPSTAGYANVLLGGSGIGVAVHDVVEVRRLAGATVIEDGAITTAKITAGAITAIKIAAGTITANEIAAGTITTTNLVAESVTAVRRSAGTAGTVANGATATLTSQTNNVAVGPVIAWARVNFAMTVGSSGLSWAGPGNLYLQMWMNGAQVGADVPVYAFARISGAGPVWDHTLVSPVFLMESATLPVGSRVIEVKLVNLSGRPVDYSVSLMVTAESKR